jgi:glutamate dehydrogenase
VRTTLDGTANAERDDLIEKAAAFAAGRKGSGGPPGDSSADLIRYFYRHVAAEDIAQRTEMDLYGAALSQFKTASYRPQGTANIRVFTPTVSEHGWSAGGHTVVEVVTDDMPFLVDSVTMELNEQNREVHMVVHPQILVRRDITGRLEEILTGDEAQVDRAELPHDISRESWMHIEIGRESSAAQRDEIERALGKVLQDVREAVEDWPKMNQQALEIIEDLDANPPPLPAEEIAEGQALLRWLADTHFTFLGYREYRLEGVEGSDDPDDVALRAVPGTGFGILRSDQDMSPSFAKLPPLVRAKAREKTLLVLAKANSKATVHRPVYLDYIGVKTFDESGEVVGERRFLGLFSSAAYTESLTRIPVLRVKAKQVIDRAGFAPLSHTGKALMDVLETYPRDELFQTPIDELVPIAESVLHTRERRQVRLFVRRDTYGRYLSCLVYLPRDRYTTAVRERIAGILKSRLGGASLEYTARVSESMLARLHFVIRPEPGGVIGDFDQADLERRLAEAARSWRDDFAAAAHAEYGEEDGALLARKYADSFPEAYKEDYSPRTGAVDLGRLERLPAEGGLDLSFYQPPETGPTEARLKIFRTGSPMSLSRVLPTLSSMGVEVVDERPYGLDGLERESHIYDFGLRYHRPLPSGARELFQDAVNAVWAGENEVDGFNALILAVGVTWRQATVLRAYAKYMRQGGTPFAQDYIEDALQQNVDITRALVALFEARFDPGRSGDIAADGEARQAKTSEIEDRIHRALDDVASLDHDRILRSYLTFIKATLRTNYYQLDADGLTKSYISLKLRPEAIPDLPEPRPKFEIFVYSPRVEGVHLRFGAVARGGLRWSDRRDDFRTEVLGLVKAQMVKNTVIVPVGAKGGFFCKQLPDPGQRDQWMAEGVACYKIFISALLDITDNLVGEETVPPERVVRHDGDDSYLVVAADKGTATFSDIANGVAKDYGFWLGDAFASGGSVGYDHKAMGITARGAWESVRRHFREMGVDCQAEDFTCVGIGDMSGDVFGNGMLLSDHIRLVAAFDHRDIFLDPSPDAASSYAERKRLFGLPRSSWQDYDKSLISEGGGVYPRSRKSIPVSAPVREALSLGDDVRTLTPAELMRAILVAPVDLLWNGGIGTYVKSSEETHTEVGDKANDVIRVDGGDLRCRCVGEGGNLGLTQRGRIEYAAAGGRINTDFIDNSAGVDTSDHEVNIKILLDRVVANGDQTEKQRNDLLASMTEEVGTLVLRDNYEQNHALANAAIQAPQLLHVHEDWIRRLERQGLLDRTLEGLPSRKTVAARLDRKQGLTTPELAVLLAYSKIVLSDELLRTGIADDPFLRNDLFSYFPTNMRQTYRDWMETHPLRREIIVTQVVNDLVNGAGITFFHRLSEETGATADELVRANFVAREIFGSRALIDEIDSYDNLIDAAVQTRMRLEMRTLVERASRWLINNRRPPMESERTVDFFGVVAQHVVTALPELLGGREADAFQARRDALVGQGVPEDLAVRVAILPPAYQALNIVETSKREDVDPIEVARVHFALAERLGLSTLVARILALPRDDRWQTMARAALRDDLHAVHAQLTAQVLAKTPADQPVPVRVADWEEDDAVVVSRAVGTLDEICSDDHADLARLSVGLRVVRTLLSPP